MTNIIADIAGNYKTLMALIDKMPDGEVVSIGDMVDRGPRSKEVVEWFMNNGRAILGNHEHMMIDFLTGGRFYDAGVWLMNGGNTTLKSFGGQSIISKDTIDWIRSLPLYLEIDGVLVSHSMVPAGKTLKDSLDLGMNAADPKVERSIIWSREEPERRDEYKMQVFGHNSQYGLRRWADDRGEFAICIDDSRHKMLTGVHLPSMEIYQQEYIDD